jgi:hypothetical protein
VGEQMGGAIHLFLIFLLHFLHQGKKWKNILRKALKIIANKFTGTGVPHLASPEGEESVTALA